MNKLENKKILVVCKETYSYPLYFLTKKWLKSGSEVAAFFFNPCETKYEKCLLNDITYYAFKKLENIKLFTSDRIADEFTNLLEYKEICDLAYLEHIESKYTHFQNLNCQIMSSQFLTRHYHYRNYMQSCTYVQQINWLILNYKNISNILDEFQPDFILDTDNAELARTILRELCYARKIPYVNIDYPRYEFHKLYSHNLSLKYSNIFEEKYKYFKSLDESILKESINYVEEFRNKTSIMHAMYINDVTSQYKPDGLFKVFRTLIGKAIYFRKQDAIGNNKAIKASNPLLYPSTKEYLKFYFNYEFRKRRLMGRNKFFHEPEDVNYLYMPLHLIPESTTFSISPLYVNELTIIEAVSKCLPAGWWLYVKEHQALVGERGTDFYEKVNRLPNVRMVKLNYYHDPKPWISKSQGVVTISGTTAYEAALMGKHSILFADTSFSLIDGIQRVNSFERLPDAISKFKMPLNNRKSCAAYIEAVKHMGYPIDIKVLMNRGEEILRNLDKIDDNYQKNLDNLEQLFVDGCNAFNEVIL